MKVKILSRQLWFVFILLVMGSYEAKCQSFDWLKLVALESSRSDVEKIIGKPTQSFETFGRYNSDQDRIHVWYSSGHCEKDTDELEYDVAPGLLTRLDYTRRSLIPISSVPLSLVGFNRKPWPNKPSQFLYYSRNNSIVVHTSIEDDKIEYLVGIELQPSREKKKFLCRTK